MPRHALVTLALLQVAVFPAGAAEFMPSWEVQGVWDSNVLEDDTNGVGDFSLRTGPTLKLREAQGDLIYDLNYGVRYDAYAGRNGIDGIDSSDQYLSARGAWAVTPNTRIEAIDSFAYTSDINSRFETTDLTSTLVLGRQRVTTNNAQASLTQRLGPLWNLSASVANQLVDYQNPQQSNTTATTGTLQLTHAFTPRLVAGAGGQYQRQDFAAVGQTPSRGTTVYQGFGVLNYSISPTWRLSARAGPAFVQPDSIRIDTVSLPSYLAVDPRTCPKRADGTPVYIQFPQSAADFCSPAFYRNAQGGVVGVLAPSPTVSGVPFVGEQNAGSSLNYFGAITLAKEWRRWHASLAYSRSASNSSGLNGSTVLDQFTGTVDWTPSPLWNLQFETIYSTQTALNQVPQREVALLPARDVQLVGGVPAEAIFGIPFEVDTGKSLTDSIDLTTIYFTLRGSRQISRRVSINGQAVYWRQEIGGVLQTARTQEIQVSIGFTWNFEAIPL
jgi:hypothetical protein